MATHDILSIKIFKQYQLYREPDCTLSPADIMVPTPNHPNIILPKEKKFGSWPASRGEVGSGFSRANYPGHRGYRRQGQARLSSSRGRVRRLARKTGHAMSHGPERAWKARTAQLGYSGYSGHRAAKASR